jgi:hypothetical protein
METVERAYDWFGYSTFGSMYVAKCSHCALVCAYWEAEDLTEDGQLLHDCDAR